MSGSSERSQPRPATPAGATALPDEPWRVLADHLPHMVWTAGPSGAADFLNRRILAYSGMGEEELVGAGWMGIVHLEDRDEVDRRWRHSVATGRHLAVECRLRRRDGDHRWHLIQAVPVHDEEGRVVRWCGTSIEVHGRKEHETALERRTDELQRSNEELDRFAAAVAHDLRAPLRKIQVYAELVGSAHAGGDEAAFDAHLERLSGCAAELHALIEDMLDYARAGRSSNAPEEPVAVADALRDARERVAVLLAEHGAQLEVGELPVVRFDRVRLVQLLQNLLENALKYRLPDRTPRIVLEARRLPGRWAISVSDNGPGIHPDDQERIFEPFQRGADSGTLGTGLGLALCRRIVRERGGRLNVVSRPGEGATFTFTAPVAD